MAVDECWTGYWVDFYAAVDWDVCEYQEFRWFDLGMIEGDRFIQLTDDHLAIDFIRQSYMVSFSDLDYSRMQSC